jgi:cell division protein ZapA (FtsZ GTPase activity inhibitor)
MAALTIADELFEARRIVAELEKKSGEHDDVRGAIRREADQWATNVADALGDVSRRIEDAAATLSGTVKA